MRTARTILGFITGAGAIVCCVLYVARELHWRRLEQLAKRPRTGSIGARALHAQINAENAAIRDHLRELANEEANGV